DRSRTGRPRSAGGWRSCEAWPSRATRSSARNERPLGPHSRIPAPKVDAAPRAGARLVRAERACQTCRVTSRGRTSVLVTLLFTDIVASTTVAEEMGDRRWRELLARHHRLIRTELKRF